MLLVSISVSNDSIVREIYSITLYLPGFSMLAGYVFVPHFSPLFPPENRNNGNKHLMYTALQCLPKFSAAFNELVRCITKEILPSNSDEERSNS